MSHGVFIKGEERRVAQDVPEAVALRFDGWAEVPTESLKGDALDATLKAADLPTTGTADEKRERLSTVKATPAS